MKINIKPRNDYVLIRQVNLGKTSTGILVSDVAQEGKQYIVEALDPDVEDLAVMDPMTGQIVTHCMSGIYIHPTTHQPFSHRDVTSANIQCSGADISKVQYSVDLTKFDNPDLLTK